MCTHFLQDVVQKPYPGTSPNPTSPRATKMPGCLLTTLSRSSDTVGFGKSTNTPSRQDQGPLAWDIGFKSLCFTHRTTHQSGEWSIQMGPSTQVWIGCPGAGHLCGKQLPGAKQPCKAPLDHIGRHVAWCARCAREIRHDRLIDFLFEYTKTTGAIATSEQPCCYPGTANQQHGKPVLFIRQTHTFPNQMARKLG